MPRIVEEDRLMLSHPLTPAGPIPTAFDPDGVYPYESYCETSRRPVLRRVRMILLENDLLRAEICPDLGGRVHALVHKRSGRNALCSPPILRPARILPRMAFVGGGLEMSFPISHTPSLLERVGALHGELGGRACVWCGERELRFGMHWTVEYSLADGEPFLTQRSVFVNPGAEAHPWMSWSNAGVPARPDTELHFPDGEVLVHGESMTTVDWAAAGPRRQSDIRGMTGFFWRRAEGPAFGVFTPSLGCGLYHVADPGRVPGMKLWSDGCGPHEAWVSQYMLDASQLLEIQAGPLADQSVKALLGPGQSHDHTEFWFPTDVPMDIRALPVPHPALAPPGTVPRFGWARPDEASRWLTLADAHRAGNPAALPAPPGPDSNAWAPSGMDDLDRALEWAADSARGRDRDLWRFQRGAWLAGRHRVNDALRALSGSGDDRAFALAGRLLRREKADPRSAAESFRRIADPALACHPQIVVERDLALAGLGPETLAERRRHLDAVSALEDEGLVERRACLLLDEGRPDEARALLEATRFQLVHQRYARTRLWSRIKKAAGLERTDPPNWLGEDPLFEFGAYREHGEG